MEGPAVATTAALVAAFPILLSAGLRASGVLLNDLIRRALAPAYTLGGLLALLLVGIRLGLDPETLPVVAVVAVAGVALYWAAFYWLVFDRLGAGASARSAEARSARVAREAR